MWQAIIIILTNEAFIKTETTLKSPKIKFFFVKIPKLRRFTQKQSNLLKLLSLGLLIVGFILFKINYSASLRSICLRDLTH